MEMSILASVRRAVVVGVVLTGSMACATAVVAGLTVSVTELTLDYIRLMSHGPSRRHHADPKSECPSEPDSLVRQSSATGR